MTTPGRKSRPAQTLYGPLEYAIHLDSISDYGWLNLTAGWPGCPTIKTYRTAAIARWAILDLATPAELIKNGPDYEGSPDFQVGLMQEGHAEEAALQLQMMFGMTQEEIALGENLHDLCQTGRYSHWAQETLRQHRSGLDEFETFQLKNELAAAGESARTIGVWIESDARVRIPGRSALVFTRLSRDPRWMGMDQALTNVAGCICFIVQSTQNAPHPSHLVAMSGSQQDRFLKDLPHGHPTGSGQDDMLRSILEYHGASAIVGVSPA